jgi:hypothetical protein
MPSRRIFGALGRRAPSPAMVVACLALLVALGGTGYAAIKLPANSVGTKQLRNGAVTAGKVRGNALTGGQIRESTLGTVPFAADADSANSADRAQTAGNATSAGSAPISRLDYQAAITFVPGGGTTATRGTVNCPTGLNAAGGGAKLADPNNGAIFDTNPVGKAGWEATALSSTAQNMTVYVICAQAASTTP